LDAVDERNSSRRLAANALLTLVATFMAGHFTGGSDSVKAWAWTLTALVGAAVAALHYRVRSSARLNPAVSAFWARWHSALLNLPIFTYMGAQSVPGLVAHHDSMSVDWLNAIVAATALMGFSMSLALPARRRAPSQS
jgi:hypothetical protein